MCGINGFFNYSNVSIQNQKLLLQSMNHTLKHRGPDDTGIWLDNQNQVYLGHQRLSILDLSEKGHQPMVSVQGNVVVYNGEIYNFKFLREEMHDQIFFSESDTEVLLRLYEQEGHQCLNRLNGMFAFALWDRLKNELFLARDRIGIKPLYYTTVNGIFAFSSEIKGLLELPWVKAELDEEALYHFLTYDYVTPPQTVFNGINKFHPGYKMVVGEHGIKLYESFWEVAYSNYDSLTGEALQQLVLNNLDKSVKLRMVSDVPVGAFLSGGVDSSAVLSLMSKYAASPVKTYSIGFKNAPDYDELIYARKVSQQFGTEHFEKIVTPQELLDFLPQVVDIFDEPLSDATSIPIYFISKLAKKNGTIVVLTGDGGDEIFSGYRRWMRYIQIYPFYKIFFKLPKAFKSLISNLYGRLNSSSPVYDILFHAAKGQFFLGGSSGFKEATKHFYLTTEYLKRVQKLDSYYQASYYQKLFESISQNGRKSSYIDLLCFMGLKIAIPNRYLYRADHQGMANSVELRVPFLDHEFVDFALSISGKWKLNKGEPKYILKKSLEGVLPNDILYRKKQGFCVPLREWTGSFILNYIEKNLLYFCRETGIFNEHGLREQINLTKAGNVNYAFSLWNIYFLMSWFKKWMW